MRTYGRLWRKALPLFACFMLVACAIVGPPPAENDTDASVFTSDSGATTFQIAHSSNDVEQPSAGGTMVLTNTALTFGTSGSTAQTAGLRFQNVNIPKGATITSAILEVKAAASHSSTTTLTITGEFNNNSSVYTASTPLVSSTRPKTSASVSWKPNAWTSGNTYRSSSLVSVIQQIVGQSGWYQGNALALQITGTGTRQAVAYDNSAANAPRLIIGYTYDPANSPTFLNRGVSQGTDDAKQPGSGTTVTTSTVLEFGQNGSTSQTVGLRFGNLTIPRGSTIDSAALEVTASASTSGSTSFTLAGEANDSAAAYTATLQSITSRPKTSASASWAPVAFTSGMSYRTTSVKDILQEIVNRSGWQSGNTAAFTVAGTGSRSVFSYEGNSAKAAKLIVNYTPPAAPTLDPAVEAALDTIEANSSFQGLGASIDKNHVYANTGSGEVALVVKESGTERGFIGAVENNQVIYLLRFELVSSTYHLVNVLNGKFTTINDIGAYGNSNGFFSEQSEQEFSELFISLFPPPSSASLSAQAIFVPADCIACEPKLEEYDYAEGGFVLDWFLMFFGLEGSQPQSSSISLHVTASNNWLNGAWQTIKDNLVIYQTYLSFKDYNGKRNAYFACLASQGFCEAILVGPNPPSFDETRKVGETFHQTITFSNDPAATVDLTYSHNGLGWPYGNAGPASGSLEPGQSASIDFSFTCTQPDRVGRDIYLETNDPDQRQVVIPAYLTCVEDYPKLVGPNPDVIDEIRNVGETFSRTVTISNGSPSAPLTYAATASDDFSITGIGSGTLNSFESQQFKITYTCTTIDSLSGGIEITSNDPKKPSANVSIALECIDGTRVEVGVASVHSGGFVPPLECSTTWYEEGYWLANDNPSGGRNVVEYYRAVENMCGNDGAINGQKHLDAYLEFVHDIAPTVFADYVSRNPGNYKGLVVTCRFPQNNLCDYKTMFDIYTYRLP